MAEDRNPPAFPAPHSFTDMLGYERGAGMSLRDWFAGQALAGLIVSADQASPAEFAGGAFLIADAMLAEREK